MTYKIPVIREDMPNVCEVINLVSDDESCNENAEDSRDSVTEDSSDDVEIISDAESSTTSLVTAHCSGNEPPEVQQDDKPWHTPQVASETQSLPRSVFIQQLVQYMPMIKQEPVDTDYEPVADTNHHVQVKSEEGSHSPVFQPRVESVVTLAREECNGSNQGLVEEAITNGISHKGIEAVIAKLGTVNRHYENEWQAFEEPPLKVQKDVIETNFTYQKDQDHKSSFPQVASVNVILEKETFPNGVKKTEDTAKAPIFCDHCGRTYFDEFALKKHVSKHLAALTEKCTLCGKKFKNQARLSYHMLGHTGERPFRCELCGAGFKVMYHLHYHMFSHTDERPHVCETCGNRYKQFCHLKQHRKKHNELFNLKCSVCGKVFHGAGTLKSHMYQHTGEWPFRCRICTKGFSNLKSCEIHESKHVKSETQETHPALDAVATKMSDASLMLPGLASEAGTQTLFPADIPPAMAAATVNMSPCEVEIKTEVPDDPSVVSPETFPFNRFLDFIT